MCIRDRYGSGQQPGFPKGGAQTAHGIDFHQIMKNKIGEQGIDAGNLADVYKRQRPERFNKKT